VPQCGGVRYRQFMNLSVTKKDSATPADISDGVCHSNPYKQEHASPFRPQHKTEDICSVRGQVVRKPTLAGIGRYLVRCYRTRPAGDKIESDGNEEAVVIESAVPYIAGGPEANPSGDR